MKSIMKIDKEKSEISVQESLIERIVRWIMNIGKRSTASYYEESCAIFDVTERNGLQYLNIGGTLIPIEFFTDAKGTLEYVRYSWITKQKNK